jgi:hypothetical protein
VDRVEEEPVSEEEVESFAAVVADELRRRDGGRPAEYAIAFRGYDGIRSIGHRRFASVTEALAEATERQQFVGDELVIIDATTGNVVDRVTSR